MFLAIMLAQLVWTWTFANVTWTVVVITIGFWLVDLLEGMLMVVHRCYDHGTPLFSPTKLGGFDYIRRVFWKTLEMDNFGRTLEFNKVQGFSIELEHILCSIKLWHINHIVSYKIHFDVLFYGTYLETKLLTFC